MGNINNPKKLCMSLLESETEEEVIKLLSEHGLWGDRSVWLPYGNIENNRGIVSNQQSSPVAALVEKIVNSVDALLIGECKRKKIDPTSTQAPKTMHAAVESLFGVKTGQIETLDSKARTALAEKIQLVATGSKSEPNYLIIDEGEGQNPADFGTTFLSLLRENKTRIPFVQGKFNMGGTGVLQFSGKNSFQLIISRKQQDLPTAEKDWGFTLIRRIPPSDSQPHSMFVYLAPMRKVPSFTADFVQALPGAYPHNYQETLSAGSCIKIWNYKLPGGLKSLATLDMRYELEKYLPSTALPIRIKERRAGYKANYYDTTMSGLQTTLADKPEMIEPGFDTGTVLNIPEVGQVKLRLVLLKADNSERHASGILFVVNGQMHSEKGKDFIARNTKLDYIADSLIVLVDCTALPQTVREDVFLASRDRMRDCPEKKLLEAAIIDYLKDHQGLREANARRREARLMSQTEEDTIHVLQGLINSDPTLASLFSKGENIRVPQGQLPEKVSYVGKKFPTFFKLHKEPQGGLIKKCPINRAVRVEYETDAENSYFSRSTDPGELV